MEAYKKEFIEFMVESHVLKFGEFTLKSGRKSPFFMNAGAYVTGGQLKRLGEYYARAIHDNFGLDFDMVFGPAYKGIPLAVVTAIALEELYGKEVKYCCNRKEVKDHGADAGNLLGAELHDGDRVIMVEDVTTSGKSIDETYPILKGAADVEVKGLIVSLNRMEVGKGGVKTAQKEVQFMPDVNKAVMGAVLAITVSEFSSLAIMSVVYLVHRKKNPVDLPIKLHKQDVKGLSVGIFSLAIPVALGGFAMQMSQVVDSVMVVNLLTVPNATGMYGLWTGPVNSMLGLPIALSGGVAVSALPSITKTYYANDSRKLQQSFNSAMKLTLVISLPCAFGMIALSKPILQLLYGSLPQEEIYIASVLLSLSGLSIVFLAVVQTCVSVCQAVGKPYATVVFVSLAIVVKAVINLLLLPNDKLNIYGAAISETMCYLFATLCVIIYLRVKVGLKMDVTTCLVKPLAAGMFMTLLITVAVVFAQQVFSSTLGTLLLIAIAGVVYFSLLSLFKVFSKEEMSMLPAKQK